MSRPLELPRWLDLVVLPLVNLALAFAVSALVLLAIGQEPGKVLVLLVKGAFGSFWLAGSRLFFGETAES